MIWIKPSGCCSFQESLIKSNNDFNERWGFIYTCLGGRMLLNWLYPPLIYLSQFRFINKKKAGFQKIEKFRNIFCNASPIPDKPENIPPILISKLSKDCLIFSQILEMVNKVLFVISQRLDP
jgi:hypothetical protein